MRSPKASLLATTALVLALMASPGLADGNRQRTTERVSVRTGGAQGNDVSLGPTISGGGRFVAFTSFATNLVPGDRNDEADVFLRDRRRGTTTRVLLGPSRGAQLARNGRFLVFASEAADLVPGDTNATQDVFVRDLRAGTTRRVSVGNGGAEANDGSGRPAISADGRFVAFASDASNLAPGDTNGTTDLFVRDRRTGTTTRESLGPGGILGNGETFTVSGPAISDDGRFVAFESAATNLVPGDTNGQPDVFLRDRAKRKTIRVSVRSDGAQANAISFAPSISADGRRVTFNSSATNLVGRDTNQADDVFVRDLRTGTTRRVSVGRDGRPANKLSFPTAALSADGRFVAFASAASNLVAGDTNDAVDVFVRDLRRGRTERVSVRRDGGQSATDSGGPFTAISADGRYVAFVSGAGDLVPGDTNDTVDIFVRDRGARTEREAMARSR